MGEVAVLSAIGPLFLVPFLGVAIDPLAGRVHGDVWLDKGTVEEEGAVPVGIEKLQGLGEDAVWGVGFGPVVIGHNRPLRFALVPGNGLLVDGFDPFVVIEKGREEGVGVTLAVVAVEAVEALSDG